MTTAGTEPTHILSFDVEEYFHVQAAAMNVDQSPDFPNRLGPVVERILERLDAAGASATFFVLGRVARTQAGLVRTIAHAGHEIAAHSLDHTMITHMTRDQFRDDVRANRSQLEDLTGRPVIGYRAPTFSITNHTAWALDVLAEQGFEYDSSIFPIRHDRYGIAAAPPNPHVAVGPGGTRILEIPPLTWRAWGKNWPVGGGGYLRLLPAWVTVGALRRAARRGDCGMIYVHPWELDAGQPVLPMGRVARWRHRVGLQSTAAKLKKLLTPFRFVCVRDVLSNLNETTDQVCRYPVAR